MFLKAYFSKLFIIKYIDYNLSGKIRPYAQDVFQIEPGSVRIDSISNDYFFEAEERQLALDRDGFYQERKALFPARDTSRSHYANPAIGASQRGRDISPVEFVRLIVVVISKLVCIDHLKRVAK